MKLVQTIEDFPFWIESINDEHLWNWIKLSMGFGLPILDKEDYWWTQNWTKLALGFDFLLCLLAERVVGERQKQGSGCSTPSSNLNTVWHKSTRIQTHKYTNTNRMAPRQLLKSSIQVWTPPLGGLQLPKSKNGDHFLSPTIPKNGGIDSCFTWISFSGKFWANFENRIF